MLVISNEEHKIVKELNKSKIPVVAINLVWPQNSGMRYHADCYKQNGGKLKMADDKKFDKYVKKKYHEQEIVVIQKESQKFYASIMVIDKKDPENLFEKLIKIKNNVKI